MPPQGDRCVENWPVFPWREILTAEPGFHLGRYADYRIVSRQSVTLAKQCSSFEDLSNSHLAPSPAPTKQRGNRVRRRIEIKIETCQNLPIFHDSPPSPTRDSEAMQERVQGDPSQGFKPRRLWPGQQIQVDGPRPPWAQWRGTDTAWEQKICERV
jgi:hypothetical protein